MQSKAPSTIFWPYLIGFAALKIIFQIVMIHPDYGFHRDEFLYLALGNHLDFGYWSNPPFIAWISFISQTVFGDSILAIRLFPIIFGGGLVVLAGLIARELGGGKYAQILACITILISTAYTRTFSMLQPVPFDVFFWTLSLYFLLRHLNRVEENDTTFLYLTGVAIGFGLLNKYTLVFFLVGISIALALSIHRKLFIQKRTWIAAGITLALILPNIIWQYRYKFPVLTHMKELSANQLVNVNPADFLSEQLIMQFAAFLIWIPGLLFLIFHPKMKAYRFLAYFYIAVLILFLVLNGKAYYTLGMYPMLLAAGAVAWETGIKQPILRVVLPILIVFINIFSLPIGLPLWTPAELSQFYQDIERDYGSDMGRRWEDGQIHALPQDFADMLGWEEIANLTEQAYSQAKTPKQCAIYCENYGQAGATDFLKKGNGLPPMISFSDTYRLWAPDELEGYNSLIYVNDELGKDVNALFDSVTLIGTVENNYAREKGTQVYLCEKPNQSFPEFWKTRIEIVKGSFR